MTENSPLSYPNFSGKTFERTSFGLEILNKSNFKDSTLTFVSMAGASLYGADFSGAKFKHLILIATDLEMKKDDALIGYPKGLPAESELHPPQFIRKPKHLTMLLPELTTENKLWLLQELTDVRTRLNISVLADKALKNSASPVNASIAGTSRDGGKLEDIEAAIEILQTDIKRSYNCEIGIKSSCRSKS